MNRNRIYVSVAIAIAMAMMATFAGTASAHATTLSPTSSAPHSAFPAGTLSAASCDDVGSVYEEQVNKWVTFCGIGYYYRPSGGWSVELIAPKTHNRWWLHQYSNNTGWTYCTDYTHEDGFGYAGIPEQYWNPGNVQVSSNTATC